MNYLSNKEGILRALTFFVESNERKTIFAPGSEIKPISAELYVNKEITIGGGKIALLSASQDNEIGITNFDGNRLDDGRAFAVDAVSFKMGLATSGTKPYNVDFAKGLTSEQKVAFQFAKLRISQKELLFELPISSILNGGETIANEYRDLPLTLIKPKDKIEIEIEFPEGVVTPTLGTTEKPLSMFVSSVFRGYETYQKR